jgi:hypothetical protein
MPASLRVIKIVKDPMTQEEAYTIEFECEADEAKNLLTELMSCPLGKKLSDLLNQADFLPEKKEMTEEEMKKQAEEEELAIKEREEKLKQEGYDLGVKEVREKYLTYIKRKRKGMTVEQIIAEVEEQEGRVGVEY